MATSIHVPDPLLKAIDRKARVLRISRNQLILRALQREVSDHSDWSDGFFERLSDCDRAVAQAADHLLKHIKSSRRSKPPREL
jgi:predicted transcriptional regulator